MRLHWDVREHLSLGGFVLKWMLVCLVLGGGVGVLVALFLWSLDQVTDVRWQHPWLLYLLPVMGMSIGWVYQRFGNGAEAGNNLIIEQIHEPGGGVPGRMAPLVLLGTLATHLCGGSAGREGTAVQMGGSLASILARCLKMKAQDQRLILMAGVAAGFGAVFGTPLAGAIFAMEVICLGKLSYEGLIPCLAASFCGDEVVTALGIQHTHYRILDFPSHVATAGASTLDGWLLGKVLVASVAFGLASVLFAELAHRVQHLFSVVVRNPVWRPVAGGLVIICLVQFTGTRDYLGLGVSADPESTSRYCLQSCFVVGGIGAWSWWWKTVFTVVTVGSGFRGGEVTPLFFVGASLGHVLATVLDAPVGLFAALGFVAVFAGATNTPLACTVMAVEVFAPGNPGILDSGFVVYAAIACCLSFFLSGHSGIYLSQRINGGLSQDAERTLRHIRRTG